MRFPKAWVVASKDFKIFKKKKSIIYTIVGFMVFVSIVLPLIVAFAVSKSTSTNPADLVSGLPIVINSFSFFFVIGAGVLPLGIASYSLIGEKIQKSLEPLLATPTTDGEILFGKAIAAFIPTIVSIYIGALIFMFAIDLFTYHLFGYLFYPNWGIALMLFVMVPLACLLSVGSNILISSKVNDVRTAQQLGSLVFLPLGAIYALSLMTILPLTTTNLWIISGALLVASIIVFYIAKATFNRDKILTEWK